MDSINKIVFFFLVLNCFNLRAQEMTVPILQSIRTQGISTDKLSLKSDIPIELPFIEDFSSYDTTSYPASAWWLDSMVYINNHFTNNHKNKGIATFDVLNQYGQAYPTDDPSAAIYCDTLTSHFINLSTYNVSDSLYLSFKYLAGGLGFAPKASDSLFIYMRDTILGWRLVDYILPTSDTSWRTKMIAITDTAFLYDKFQFRIINKGTIGISSSHWHIDDMYLNIERHRNDTLSNDVAFSRQSNALLSDFTAMPFGHFITDRNRFMADSITSYHYFQSPTGVIYSTDLYTSIFNTTTGAILGSNTSSINIPGNLPIEHKIPNFNPTSWTADASGQLSITLKQYISTPTTDVMKYNDTIIRHQIFDNYFAYDDGTAEQAYFLNLSPGAPGKIAIEYALFTPDTLRGIDIQFIAQVPDATYKEFYIQVYKDIEIGGSGGTLVYEQGGNYPVVSERPDAFITYPFHTPVALDPGVYYVSIMMPASGVSDSLMIALDKNRIGGNHRYYNVLDVWESSTLEGALMVRPIVGAALPSGINSPNLESSIVLYPNPSGREINIVTNEKINHFNIINVLGQPVLQDNFKQKIDIHRLPSGQYYFLANIKGNIISIPFTKQ